MLRLIPLKYGLLPSKYWTTEINGMGKAIRFSMGWPRILPIPFYCDHGVAMRGTLQAHELSNKAQIFITWNEYRYEALKKSISTKEIYFCEHPWLRYRRISGIEKSRNAKGTLLFIPHSTTNGITVSWNRDIWLEKVKENVREYPLSVMLHPADINDSTLEWCLQNGLNYFTAGDNFDKRFIDTWYNIVRQFNFAFGAFGGSELFYCHDLGVEYRIIDVDARLINSNTANDVIGDLINVDELRSVLTQVKLKLFDVATMATDDERDSFVDKILGKNSTVTLKSLRKKMFKYLFR